MPDASLDVLGAVHDFLQARLSPQPEHIVRGWQNRAALPDASAYVVLTLINASRRGTNVHDWKPSEAALIQNARMLVAYDVQVDFCGLDEAAVSAQAAQLVLFGRDAAGVLFFQPYGLSCLYADDPRSLPFGDDLDQWKVRYAVTLHLSAWIDAAIPLEAFRSVNLSLENVDVHHPIQGV